MLPCYVCTHLVFFSLLLYLPSSQGCPHCMYACAWHDEAQWVVNEQDLNFLLVLPYLYHYWRRMWIGA